MDFTKIIKDTVLAFWMLIITMYVAALSSATFDYPFIRKGFSVAVVAGVLYTGLIIYQLTKEFRGDLNRKS